MSPSINTNEASEIICTLFFSPTTPMVVDPLGHFIEIRHLLQKNVVGTLKEYTASDYQINRKLQFKEISVINDIGNARLPFTGKHCDSSIINRIST